MALNKILNLHNYRNKKRNQSPDAFNNLIHFSNGSIFQLVSLDHKDSGRGLNSYAIFPPLFVKFGQDLQPHNFFT